MKRIGIIGCGNMGEAILLRCRGAIYCARPSGAPPRRRERGLDKSSPYNFVIVDKNKLRQDSIRRKYRVGVAKNIDDLVAKSDVIIIAVKPQDVDGALDQCRGAIYGARTCKRERGFDKSNPYNGGARFFISIAAGITTKYIEDKIGGRVRVIRAMPNMPAKIGQGITALVKGRFAGKEDLKTAAGIFECLGEVIEMPKEELMDVVTAVSGSGPAYFFLIFEAMLKAAEELGLCRDDAEKLLYQTVKGAIELLAKEEFSCEELISKVASKGGTTEAALKVFKERGLDGIIRDAIVAAYKRAGEIRENVNVGAPFMAPDHAYRRSGLINQTPTARGVYE